MEMASTTALDRTLTEASETSSENPTTMEEMTPLNVDSEMGVHDQDPSKSSQSSSSSATSSQQHHQEQHGSFMQLAFGAGGIYTAFLYYGSLQEDVFRYEGVGGAKFSAAWLLQFLEAAANVIVALVGRHVTRGTPNLPLRPFFITGATQVCSKAFTSLALASGLSFPVATLAKSGKMAPVMMGQLVLGGASYSLRDYLQVAAIIGGTAMLSLGKKKGGESHSTPLGLFFICTSLAMDGITGGLQKRIKSELSKKALKAKPYDFMLFTNISMMVVALAVSLVLGDFFQGYEFCMSNPAVWGLMFQFSVCSAVGQSFIFYTVAHFDPLVCSTITTTRKILSVLISILFKGHVLSAQAWAGVSLAIGGIASEVQAKIAASRKVKS